MDTKSKTFSVALSLAMVMSLGAPASAQSSRPMIAVPVADVAEAKPVVANFASLSQDIAGPCRTHLQRQEHLSGAEMVRKIQMFRTCKAERLLHANDVWKGAS